MPDRGPVQALDDITAAAASDRGLPELIRAVGRALSAGLMLCDTGGSVLVFAGTTSDEQALASRGKGVEVVPLEAGGQAVGELRLRRPAGDDDLAPEVEALIFQLVAAELGRQQLPVQASEEAAAEFLSQLAGGARAETASLEEGVDALGVELDRGVVLLVARARVQSAAPDGWRERITAAAWRGARAVSASSIAAASPGEHGHAEAIVLVRAADDDEAARATESVLRELRLLPGHTFAIGRSRVAKDLAELSRTGSEALLAVNVAEGGAADEDGHRVLAFEDTGAYRLLLPAMSEDPDELRRFFEETIAPVVSYDEQYETNLVQTLDAFLDADGNVAGTAQRLFTHRHTIRYRLERVRELSGFDVGSTEGRERLSLGLKAMRVLGIPAPGGPAGERQAAENPARAAGS